MSSNTWVYGSHIGIQKTLFDTLKYAKDAGIGAFQFFLGSPTGYNRRRLTKEDIEKTWSSQGDMKIFSHVPYIFNLCGSKDSLAWNGDEDQDVKTTRVIKELQYELGVLSEFSGGCVIHPGSYKNRGEGLLTIAKSINTLFQNDRTGMLILENSSGQGNTLATTLEELKTIIDNVEAKEHIGVCIDTCHLYAYGSYDISNVEEMKRMFVDFDAIIGLRYLKLIHLNDSMEKLGSKKDRHAQLGHGHIWSEGNESLVYLLNKCGELEVPVVLETTVDDINILHLLADRNK